MLPCGPAKVILYSFQGVNFIWVEMNSSSSSTAVLGESGDGLREKVKNIPPLQRKLMEERRVSHIYLLPFLLSCEMKHSPCEPKEG